jgi:hypothetical protein
MAKASLGIKARSCHKNSHKNGGVGQVGECLLIKLEALSSTLVPLKKKRASPSSKIYRSLANGKLLWK